MYLLSNVFKAILLLFVLSVSLTSCKFTHNLGITKPKKQDAPSVVVDETGKKARKADNPNISLDNFTEESLRSSIVSNAMTYQGIRYKYAGRSPQGFDCSGFTCYVMSEYGINLSPASRMQATQGRSVALENVKPGDLLFFSRYGPGGTVSHVAMVASNTSEGIKMVHSSSSRGVVEEMFTGNKYWTPKFLYAKDVLSEPTTAGN